MTEENVVPAVLMLGQLAFVMRASRALCAAAELIPDARDRHRLRAALPKLCGGVWRPTPTSTFLPARVAAVARVDAGLSVSFADADGSSAARYRQVVNGLWEDQLANHDPHVRVAERPSSDRAK